jgi:hypothetical protein
MFEVGGTAARCLQDYCPSLRLGVPFWEDLASLAVSLWDKNRAVWWSNVYHPIGVGHGGVGFGDRRRSRRMATAHVVHGDRELQAIDEGQRERWWMVSSCNFE